MRHFVCMRCTYYMYVHVQLFATLVSFLFVFYALSKHEYHTTTETRYGINKMKLKKKNESRRFYNTLSSLKSASIAIFLLQLSSTVRVPLKDALFCVVLCEYENNKCTKKNEIDADDDDV